MKNNDLLNYLKGLPIVPKKNDKGETTIVYDRKYKMSGLLTLTPRSNKQDIIEANNWLIDNKLFLPVSKKSFSHLIIA